VNTELIGAAIFVITTIFAAGGIVWTTRKELAQTKIDVNRVGQKIRDEERSAWRRHYNSSPMQVAVEDDRDTRFKICGQLKED
jgi:hypothetical protein